MKKIVLLIGGAFFSLTLNSHAALIECPDVNKVKNELNQAMAELRNTMERKLSLPRQQMQALGESEVHSDILRGGIHQLLLHPTPLVCQYKVNNVVIYQISRQVGP